MRSDDSLATVLLTSQLASDGLRPLKASEYWALRAQVGAPGALLGADAASLVHERGLSAEAAARIVALLGRATAMALEIDGLDQSGIVTLTPFDEHYPPHFAERLGARAPAVLHAAGALGLLDRPGAGIIADIDTSDDGAEVARALATEAARSGLPLVGGGGGDIDRAAVDAALGAGGSAVGILADSLVRTLRQPAMRRAVYGGRTLMCTPYRPDAAATAVATAGRAKLIYAQSLATLVVATADGSGSIWAGAVEALTEGYGPVAVWRGPGEGPGNSALEERGAIPVVRADAASLSRLWQPGSAGVPDDGATG